MKINVLEPKIYNRIAAGEVVERPASVVKELVENSLDAGSTKVKIEILEGGIKKIQVSDNGCGIEKDDLPLAFLPHATSKISKLDDLDAIATLGFRGEALASISSVSRVKLSTKTKNSETGYQIDATGGEISKITQTARLDGTTICVEDLFFNTPARAKFLRKPKSEEGDITHIVEKFMLSHPEVTFEYVVDERVVYQNNSHKLDEVIYQIYGRDVFENLLPVSCEDEGTKVTGYVCSPKLSRPNRTYQSLFVNGRYVESFQMSACIQGAFEAFLMKGRFPIYILNLSLDFDKVDVNVHPNKKEVKFENNSGVFRVVRRGIENAIVGANLIAEFSTDEKYERDDKEPERMGFDSQIKPVLDKLSADEGTSFKTSVDDESLKEKFLTPNDYKKKGIDIINMPNFSTIKGDESRKNKPGGNIFFDHSGESLLREVRSQVEKEKAEKFLTARAEEIKIVGVVFKTYIITEFEDSLYVVDQHAMHERQLYDKLKAQIEKNNISKQDLLLPYEFSLVAQDKVIFEDKIPSLEKLGFEISQSGNKFSINSVPYLLSQIKLDKFVEEVLTLTEGQSKSASGLINEKLCQTACKHAIRAGDDVTKEEILYLIDEMKGGIMLCPHGRPIVVKITQKELEKMFKRTL